MTKGAGRIAFVLAALAVRATAAEWEIEGRLGQALPTYKQTYAYDPGPLSIQLPGIGTVGFEQRSPFSFDGQGGSAYGASLTLYPAAAIGIEARFDSPAVNIEAHGAIYHVTANLPAPLPDIAQDVAIDSGTIDVDRLRPLSLNLKLRTPGHVAFTLSAGVSYLPAIRVTAQQPIGFAAASANPLLAPLNAGHLRFRAEIRPEDDKAVKRIGGNAGAGVSVAVSAKVRLSAEARVFAFSKHRLDWEPVISGPLSGAEQALFDTVRPRLSPIEFSPTFFQATVGVAIRL
jgi:hypothetical protein